MWRPIVLACCLAYFVALASLGAALHRAAPNAGDRAIAGVMLGNYVDRDDRAFVAVGRLECVPTVRDDRPGSRCTVAIAGETLEIDAWRNPPENPNQLGGICEARYAGRARSCWIGSPATNVHFVAYIGESLGLSDRQFAALRRRYFLENLDEWPFLVAIVLVPSLTALVAAAGTAAACWTGPSRRALAGGLALGVGLVTLPLACVGTALLTGWFFD